LETKTTSFSQFLALGERKPI